VLDPEVRARKREACRAYASQIGFQFGGPERLDQQLAAVGDVVAGRHQLAHHSHPVFFARGTTRLTESCCRVRQCERV
jgi:hypothetical protein